jgi:hypothetical protein
MMADLEYMEIEVVEQPSRTYRLDAANDKILGKIDELEAIKQAIYLRLSIEKYENIIYSSDYGIELVDLFGEPITYVIPEIQRRITEELLKDDRINNVDDFSFIEEKGSVTASFIVHTTLGDVDTQMEVAI